MNGVRDDETDDWHVNRPPAENQRGHDDDPDSAVVGFVAVGVAVIPATIAAIVAVVSMKAGRTTERKRDVAVEEGDMGGQDGTQRLRQGKSERI